ncbi:hypothetical protein DID80_08300, partial [Candidatus Marinamargulisbacteria bacterium SCGC AAA071-K20]
MKQQTSGQDQVMDKKPQVTKQKDLSKKLDLFRSKIDEPKVFAEHFLSNFNNLIDSVYKQDQDALDKDTIKQAKLLFHNLKSKLNNLPYKTILKNLSMMKVKSAYNNKRVTDVSIFYANQLYKTSNTTNPEGLKDLMTHIEKEQQNIAVKGKIFEIIYAAEYAKKGCKVQFGCVDGKGGDVVVYDANEYEHSHKTVQLKYITGASENKFKDHCRIAAEQLGVTRKGRLKTE